jgi:hypothetical protein
MGRLRKVVGYGVGEDPNPNDPAPESDGVFLLDMNSGESRLVVPISEVYGRILKKWPELDGYHMWFNHVVFNKSGTRFFFLARAYVGPERQRHTAMFTANRDGSELREVIGFDRRVSHFDWRNDREIIATFILKGSGRQHVLFTDGEKDYRVVGEGFLDFDGHCSFSPDQRWILTDRKHHDTLSQSLMIYDMQAKRGHVLCRYDMFERKYISGNVRCDFHPRWSRDGRKICFDAIEPKGRMRQLHVVRLRRPSL